MERISSCRGCACVYGAESEGQILELAGCFFPLIFPNKMCSVVKLAEEPSVPQPVGDSVKVSQGRQVAP